MNKYKEAIKVVDTVLHHMCGEKREDGYLPTMEEISNSMDLLKNLANKSDSYEWIPFVTKNNEITSERPLEYEVILVTDGYKVWSDLWSNLGGYFGLASGVALEGLAWVPMPELYKNRDYCLSEFEYELLESYLNSDEEAASLCIKDVKVLQNMQKKGYFRNVDNYTPIRDILECSEIKKGEKEDEVHC